MAMNRIQFEPGMSLPEFLRGFGTEERCVEAVFTARWPDGFSSTALCRQGSRHVAASGP